MLKGLRAFYRRLTDFPYKRDLAVNVSVYVILFLPAFVMGISFAFSGSGIFAPRYAYLGRVIPTLLLIILAAGTVLVVYFLTKWIYPLGLKIASMESRHTSPETQEKSRYMLDSLESLDLHFTTYAEREYTLKLLQKQAELDALQGQINPHFLYNTLDTIRGQALDDGSTQTSDMIEALSTLLRYTISLRSDMVTLGQELKSLDNYIKIQQYRFRQRFTYSKTIDDLDGAALSRKVPKLILQPFVENAIFHGVESISREGHIDVEVFTTQSRLVVSITDNGVGMDEKQLERLRKKLNQKNPEPEGEAAQKPGSGIAISNVNARIKLAFGDDYGVSVYSTSGIGSQFQIVMPLADRRNEN